MRMAQLQSLNPPGHSLQVTSPNSRFQDFHFHKASIQDRYYIADVLKLAHSNIPQYLLNDRALSRHSLVVDSSDDLSMT